MAVMTPSVPERPRTRSVPVSIVPRRSARTGPVIRLSPGLTCGHRGGASVASLTQISSSDCRTDAHERGGSRQLLWRHRTGLHGLSRQPALTTRLLRSRAGRSARPDRWLLQASNGFDQLDLQNAQTDPSPRCRRHRRLADPRKLVRSWRLHSQ
jgi:hypothetical protein